MDSDWLSMFYQLQKIVLKVIPMISFECAIIVIVAVWTFIFRTISFSLYLSLLV